jgi:hypothetical protein
VNPARGPYHFRAPSKILWRTVRGKMTLYPLSYARFFIASFKSQNDCEEEVDTPPA